MNTGNRGKFSDRIKKIARSKHRVKKSLFTKDGTIKRIVLIPLMFLDKKIHENKKQNNKETSVNLNTSLKNKITGLKYSNQNINVKENYNNIQKKYKQKQVSLNTKSKVVNKPLIPLVFVKKDNLNTYSAKKINSNFENKDKNNDILLGKENNDKKVISSNDVLKKKNDFLKDNKITNKIPLISDSDTPDNDRIEKLNGKIVSDISKYLIKNINELKIIESDLFVLSKFDGNKESLDKCREYIAKLKALQNKLNKIRKDFNILKVNVDFDSILDISDNNLLDELIEFRNMVGNDASLNTTRNYKLLEEYKYLYVKIDKVVEETDKLEVEIINRKDELEQAGIKFDDFQKKVYSFDKIEASTSRMLDKQDRILSEISNKVSDVSVTKDIQRKYKGFGSLLFNSFKLFGLYMLTPFKNSIPGIAVATVATKKTVDNLLATSHVEERVKYIYHAEDYGRLLSSAISDLSDLDSLLVTSLKDIRRVKGDFLNQFAQYSSELPKYNTVLRKLNQLEKELIANQVKVRVTSQRTSKKKKENEQTLVKVKKLNNN